MEHRVTRRRGLAIVCALQGTWAAELRRAGSATRLRVYEARHGKECLQQLEAAPASLVAWDAAIDRLPDWLLRQQKRFPRSRSIVLATREQAQAECLWREAGAVHVARGLRELPAVVRMITRHLHLVTPPPSEDDQIRSQLPWSDDP